MLNPAIFKKYDIRGQYPTELSEKDIPELVSAYITTFNPQELIIGHDPLYGSKVMYDPLCAEFSKYGVTVLQAGEVSTPMLYFACAFYKVTQGIMLTASHLGTHYTGLKVVIDGVPPTQEQILELKNAQQAKLNTGNVGKTVHLTTLVTDYQAKLLELVQTIGNPTRYKLGIDASNGPNAKNAQTLFTQLGLTFELINAKVRENQLAHETNPKIDKNREQLKALVLQKKYDLGILWDGDCDRAFFIDAQGELISPEFVGLQIAKYLVQQRHGNTVTIDIRASHAIPSEIHKLGGVTKRIPAWHVPIKVEMKNNADIVFGLETSGHYVFRDMFKSDDGLLAALVFLKSIYNEQESLTQLLKTFKANYKTIEERNFFTPKSEQTIINEVKTTYRDAKLDFVDGVTIEYNTWRANIRASKTEPIIRVNMSGTNEEFMYKNLEKLTAIIGGNQLN